MRGWSGRLKCETFRSRQGKYLCVPYKKLLRYAQEKPDATPIIAGPYGVNLSMSELASPGMGMENFNVSMAQILEANAAMENLVSNMANETDIGALIENLNQMTALATSYGIDLPEGMDPESLSSLAGMQLGPGMFEGTEMGPNLNTE